jgi:transcriptional regulator with XRE-family HTH domain
VASPREQLADLLKRARIDAGYGSHLALARKINVSRSLVAKAESATQPLPSDPTLVAWHEATGVDIIACRELIKRAKSGNAEWFMPFRAAEVKAETLWYWSPLHIPGPFQTESCARAVLSVEEYTPEELADLLTGRMERKDVIGRAYITVIIDEHNVLHRRVGSPSVMAEQCAYLADLAARPRIAVHVIPEGVDMGLWGGLSLAIADNTTTVVLVAFEDVTTTATRQVGKAMRAFERLLGAAMPCAESLDFIQAMEEQWKAQI